MSKPLLQVDLLNVAYSRRSALVVRDVSLELVPGETLALIGESGSGKSTLLRCLAGLVPARSGEVVLGGEALPVDCGRYSLAQRRRLQMVFQDPRASLDGRLRALDIVAEPLDVQEPRLAKEERRRRVAELLADVGLDEGLLSRHPHELSGGQCQRLGIARALIAGAELLLLDEPVSALDVSVQAQVLSLLERLRESQGLSFLFVTHDLAVARQIADRICVMHQGRIVESGGVDEVLREPRHEYTRELLAAARRRAVSW